MSVFLEFSAIITHSPLFVVFILFIKRIRCRAPYLLTYVVGTILSVLYHACKMIGGQTCLYSFPFHKLLDHDGSESMVLATAIIMAPFKREWVRLLTFLTLVIAMIFYKISMDNVWFGGGWSVFFFVLSIPRMYTFREFHFGVVSGAIGLFCFYSEPEGGDIILHDLWHLFSISSSVFFNLAAARYPCDKITCTCGVREPRPFWTASWKELIFCSYTKKSPSPKKQKHDGGSVLRKLFTRRPLSEDLTIQMS